MKQARARVAVLLTAAILLTGCIPRKKAPSDWYQDVIGFYEEGFKTGDWSRESTTMFASSEQKTELYRYGYLLIDLDGDGTDELLIGKPSAGPTTFTNLYVWHNDLEEGMCLLSGTIYLCNNNIIRMENYDGTSVYYEFNSESNSFSIRSDITLQSPVHYDLTLFDLTR